MNVETLMKKPWTRVGPTKVEAPEGTHFEIRIAELPDFFVAGLSEKEALAEFSDALRAFLISYLERDELPPLPELKWQITEVAWRRTHNPPDARAPIGASAELVRPTCPAD